MQAYSYARIPPRKHTTKPREGERMKTYVQVSARLDVDTARQLETLKREHGTTVAALTAAIRHLHSASDTVRDTAASTPTAPTQRNAEPVDVEHIPRNARYGQTAQELETLARILELDKAGYGLSAICKELNAEQRKPRTGNAWTIQRLSTILKTAKGGNE